MKHKLIILALVGGAGVYLYQRGRATHEAVGQRGDLLSTLRAGAASLYASARASTPTTQTAPPARESVASAGGGHPAVPQTVPERGERELVQLAQPRNVTTLADLLAQGIAI